MYNRPLVLGIDSNKAFRREISTRQLLADFGNNTGNLVFSEAVFRSLANARRSPYAFDHGAAIQSDVLVIAAANWLNPYSDFGALADRLEATQRPVVIVGLGAQSTLDHSIPKLTPGTLKLVRLASESSKCISVRGDFTREVLNAYGVTNVRATGCPSLLLSGATAPSIDRSRLERPIVLHATRHLFNLADPYQLRIYRESYQQRIDLVLQSELADAIVRRGADEDEMEAAGAVLAKVYDTDDLASVTTFLREKARIFFTLEDWMAFLKESGPCVGTRIHGTVMAILSGTPAVLVAHDSRTLEMAKKMSIPYVLSEQFKEFRSEDIRDLARGIDYDDLTRGYTPYLKEFINFFDENGLPVAEGIRP